MIAVLLGGQEVWAKIYSVQIGAFQKYQNAQRQFKQFEKSVPSNLSDYLRIEKKGHEYVLKVGKLDEPEKALNLLSALKEHSPDAFVWKGDWVPKNILEMRENPVGFAADHPKEEKVLHPEGKKNEPPPKAEQPLIINQALLTGTIREISSFPPEQLGMPSGKNIYRLIIRVESSKALKGGPDFIKEREGELLTVFSEINPPIFRPGLKIKGVVEYRGNRFSRYYWIHKPQAVNP
ncbi:MAG: SPOR domain-containing protein [Deltaproteobacteria bacterium]|nr:SPOR domain-containing protein [Deltaproteobacteria bacterium]